MCAVPNMAVFCSSLTSCFPGMLLTYFLNDFEIVPVALLLLVIIIIIIIIIITYKICFLAFHVNSLQKVRSAMRRMNLYQQNTITTYMQQSP